MRKPFLIINTFSYLAIAAFLVTSIATSMISGYPWSLTCYSCVLCRQNCPLGIDPHGFLAAGITGDPHLYVATGMRLRLGEAADLDPDMLVRKGGGPAVTASAALQEGWSRPTEVIVERMKVKEAARYCFLCGACEKACPIDLRIMDIIKDLKDDGRFKR